MLISIGLGLVLSGAIVGFVFGYKAGQESIVE